MKYTIARALHEDIRGRGFGNLGQTTKYDPSKTGAFNTAEWLVSGVSLAAKKAASYILTKIIENSPGSEAARIIKDARAFAKGREVAAESILSTDGFYSVFEGVYSGSAMAKKRNLSRCLGLFKVNSAGEIIQPPTLDTDPDRARLKQGCDELRVAAAISIYRDMEYTISSVFNPDLRRAIADSGLISGMKELGEYGPDLAGLDLLDDDAIRPLIKAKENAERIYTREVLRGKRPVFTLQHQITYNLATAPSGGTVLNLCPGTTITESRSFQISVPLITEAPAGRGGRGTTPGDTPYAAARTPVIRRRREPTVGSAEEESGDRGAPLEAAGDTPPVSLEEALERFRELHPATVSAVRIDPEKFRLVRSVPNILAAASSAGFKDMQFPFPTAEGAPPDKPQRLDTQGSISLERIVTGIGRWYLAGGHPQDMSPETLSLIAKQLAPSARFTAPLDIDDVSIATRSLFQVQSPRSGTSVKDVDDSARAFLLVLYHIAHVSRGLSRSRSRELSGRMGDSPQSFIDRAGGLFRTMGSIAASHPDDLPPELAGVPRATVEGQPPTIASRLGAMFAAAPGGYSAMRSGYRRGGRSELPGLFTPPDYVAVAEEEDALREPDQPQEVEDDTVKNRVKLAKEMVAAIIKDIGSTARMLTEAIKTIANQPAIPDNKGHGGTIPFMHFTWKCDNLVTNDAVNGATAILNRAGYQMPSMLSSRQQGLPGERVWEAVRELADIPKPKKVGQYDVRTHYVDWRPVFYDDSGHLPKPLSVVHKLINDGYLQPAVAGLLQFLRDLEREGLITSDEYQVFRNRVGDLYKSRQTTLRRTEVKVAGKMPVERITLLARMVAVGSAGTAMAVPQPQVPFSNSVTVPVERDPNAPIIFDVSGMRLPDVGDADPGSPAADPSATLSDPASPTPTAPSTPTPPLSPTSQSSPTTASPVASPSSVSEPPPAQPAQPGQTGLPTAQPASPAASSPAAQQSTQMPPVQADLPAIGQGTESEDDRYNPNYLQGKVQIVDKKGHTVTRLLPDRLGDHEAIEVEIEIQPGVVLTFLCTIENTAENAEMLSAGRADLLEITADNDTEITLNYDAPSSFTFKKGVASIANIVTSLLDDPNAIAAEAYTSAGKEMPQDGPPLFKLARVKIVV